MKSELYTYMLLCFAQVLLLAKCGNCDFSKPFFQFSNNNLTQVIHKVLLEQKSKDILELKQALMRSPFVYYETDVMLGEIDLLLPVVDLLDTLNDRDSPQPQLLISLRYVNKTSGKFLWKRLGDGYYDAEFHMSFESRRKITKRVAAFLLDFYSVDKHIYDNDYLKNVWSKGSKISFPTCVKEILQLQFGVSYIPQVGVRFGLHQKEMYEGGSGMEIVNADFVNLVIDAVNEFPIDVKKFSAKLNDKLSQISGWNRPTRDGISKMSNHSDGASTFANVEVFLTFVQNNQTHEWIPQLSNFLDRSLWWNQLLRLVTTTKAYQNISEHLVESARSKAPQVFNDLLWKLSQNQNANFSVDNDVKWNKFDDKRESFVIPYVQMNDAHADGCELNHNITYLKSKYDAIMVDEVTWAAMKRLRKYPDRFSSVCAAKPDQGGISPLQVIITVNDGIRDVWTDTDVYMKKLIYENSSFSGLHGKTVIFSEDDICESKGIQKFLTFGSCKSYKTGCAVSLELFQNKLLWWNNQTSVESFKSGLESTMCAPMFQSIDTFLWKVAVKSSFYPFFTSFPSSGLFSVYTAVFITREIFMHELPAKNVIIQFTESLDLTTLAQVYSVPLVVPQDSILFYPEKKKLKVQQELVSLGGARQRNDQSRYFFIFVFTLQSLYRVWLGNTL